METEDKTLCCGCLCFGRKMTRLSGGRELQCFTQIIGDISLSKAEETQVQLCWECYARLNNFVKFTKQVKRSYNLFSEYLKQNKPKSFLHFSSPNLTTHKQFPIDLQPTESTEYLIEVIKTENQRQLTPEPYIKEEYDTAIPETNSDDEKLIDISKKTTKVKKKNAKVKKKKRKRKEGVFKEIGLSQGEEGVHNEIELSPREEGVFKEIELSREELEEERRAAMLAEHYVNAMFHCERCIVSFPNAEDLNDHVRLKHELYASNYKCSICECSFRLEISYNYHIKKHTRRYQCRLCTERFSSKGAVNKHYQLIHGPLIEYETQNAQHENGLKTDDTNALKDNSITQQSAKFPCQLCNKVFIWKTSLRKHEEAHRIETGQKRKPYCEPCRLSFATTSNLQKHVKTSSKHQIQVKLRKLAASQPLSESTSEHIDQIRNSVNTERQKYPCEQCGKVFQWRGNLLRHVNTHVSRAKGDLVCEPCNRTFASIATYRQHLAISKKHNSENEFKFMCSECGKRFPNKFRLREHVNWEHLKNFVNTCNICQKVFKSSTSLYLHKQGVHKNISSGRICDRCGKTFPNYAKLRYHIVATHRGPSPYKCVPCGIRFSWQSCLSRHNRKVHAVSDKEDKNI